MAAPINSAIATCERVIEALLGSEALREEQLRVTKARDVLSEHEARSLWLRTSEGKRFLRSVERAALKLERKVASQPIGEDVLDKQQMKRKKEKVEQAVRELEDRIEDLRREIEKRTFYIT